MKISVERLPDGQIWVSKGTWHDTFAADRLEPWAAWYEGMYARHGYPGYLAMAQALRALA